MPLRHEKMDGEHIPAIERVRNPLPSTRIRLRQMPGRISVNKSGRAAMHYSGVRGEYAVAGRERRRGAFCYPNDIRISEDGLAWRSLGRWGGGVHRGVGAGAFVGGVDVAETANAPTPPPRDEYVNERRQRSGSLAFLVSRILWATKRLRSTYRLRARYV